MKNVTISAHLLFRALIFVVFQNWFADDCSLALGHISLPDNLKVLFTHHYLVVVFAVDTSIYCKVADCETLGSWILALFIGCTQLDAFLLDTIILIITLQYSDVKISLNLSVYQLKLVPWVVECYYEGISSFVVDWNRFGKFKEKKFAHVTFSLI